MANILILESNDKIAFQCLKLIDELDSRSNAQWESSYEQFEKKYFLNSDDDDRLPTIDVIFFSQDIPPYDLTQWIDDFVLKCKQYGYSTEAHPIKFICLKYEDKGLTIDGLIHPHIYDIIYVPLDRLVFLQKLEIIKSLPQKVNPSFLFSEPVNLNIEISKISPVKKLSRHGFTLVNPMDLARGTLAKVILQISNDTQLKVMARVISSQPDTRSKTGEFQIQFAFAQVDRNLSVALSKFISNEDPEYTDLINDRKGVFKPDANLSAQELNLKNIFILGPEKEAHDLKSDILDSFFNTEVDLDSDYTTMQNKYFLNSKASPTRIGTTTDLSKPAISFLVDSKKKTFLELETALGNEDFIIDYNCLGTVFNDPQSWLCLFDTSQALQNLEEFFTQRKQNLTSRKIIELTSINGVAVSMAFEGTHISDNEMRVQISPPNQKEVDILKKKVKSGQLPYFDLVIIYKQYIPENFNNWLTHFIERAIENGLTSPNYPFSFIVIDAELDGKFSDLLSHERVLSVFQNKSISKSIMPTIAYALKTPFSVFNTDNQNYLMVDFKAHICKRAQLNFVSEFGASITADTPIQPGSLLYLHGSLFKNAHRGMLAARFYSSDKVEDEDKNISYISSFLYFGITDSFLKFARQWIRENYAELKQAENERIETKN